MNYKQKRIQQEILRYVKWSLIGYNKNDINKSRIQRQTVCDLWTVLTWANNNRVDDPASDSGDGVLKIEKVRDAFFSEFVDLQDQILPPFVLVEKGIGKRSQDINGNIWTAVSGNAALQLRTKNWQTFQGARVTEVHFRDGARKFPQFLKEVRSDIFGKIRPSKSFVEIQMDFLEGVGESESVSEALSADPFHFVQSQSLQRFSSQCFHQVVITGLPVQNVSRRLQVEILQMNHLTDTDP